MAHARVNPVCRGENRREPQRRAVAAKRAPPPSASCPRRATARPSLYPPPLSPQAMIRWIATRSPASPSGQRTLGRRSVPSSWKADSRERGSRWDSRLALSPSLFQTLTRFLLLCFLSPGDDAPPLFFSQRHTLSLPRVNSTPVLLLFLFGFTQGGYDLDPCAGMPAGLAKTCEALLTEA